jgi:hypothetical protein
MLHAEVTGIYTSDFPVKKSYVCVYVYVGVI